MHYSDLYLFKDFYLEFLKSRSNEKLRALDVGSRAIGNMGVFGRYLKNPNWEYVGLDMTEGRNVDIISEDPYNYPFEDNSFDVVISGSTMEHVEDIYAWIKELSRITKEWVWIAVPNTCKEHKYPIDCWRVFPDGMKFLLGNVAGLEVMGSGISRHERRTTFGFARKIKI